MTREWIAYVGPFKFPWGQAGSRRVFGNARTLAAAGYDVRIGCGESSPPLQLLDHDERTGATISWCGLSELPPTGQNSLTKAWTQLIDWGKKTTKWLSTQDAPPKFVIVYGGLAAFGSRVARWCRDHDVPFLVDVVEWYDPKQLPGGRLGPFYFSSQIALKHIYPKADGLIVISSFLDRYYRESRPTIIIPPTFTELSPPSTIRLSERHLKLVYAGTPGHKDLLGDVISSVIAVNHAGHNVDLLVIGPDSADVAALAGKPYLPSFISALGHIPQADVKRHIAASDFSILVRPSERFTNAGFPTKFVESIAVGTPVIANCTSDICLHLNDGENGIAVSEPTITEITQTLIRAALLPLSERNRMREAAYQTALRSFHYSAYVEPIKGFLSLVDGQRTCR